MWRAALRALLVAAFSVPPAFAATQDYSDAACRRYPTRAVLMDIKARVEALRRIEREAADRLIGLDTRPYEWLLGQAQAAEAAIAIPALVAAEKAALERCRIVIPSVRRDCAVGAAALVRVLGELVAGDASNEAKMVFAQTMPSCERWAGLKPLDTALRSFTRAPEPAGKRLRDAAR
jgi:hypothetical protein